MALSMSKACISSIKDILMCAVCLEDVKEPRTLVCHHSFCMSCLKSIELTGRGSQQKLQCPKCRKYTNVPRGIVGYLPMDCKLNELSELHNQVAELAVSQSIRFEATQPVKCGAKQLSGHVVSPAVEPEASQVVQPIVCVACTGPTDKNDNINYYYCTSCHDYLCTKCTAEHKETPLFKDHDLIDLVGKFVVDRKLCQDHSLKSKDYHCEDCKQLVCSVCVTKNHREHTVRHFEEYDKICREKIANQSPELFCVFHVPIYFQLYGFIGDVTEPLMTRLDLTTDEITKKISEVANTITMDIERQKHELTDLVKKQHSTIQKILSAHILRKRCEGLRWCKDPGVLLNEHQKLSKEVHSFLDENGDEEIPELTIDSDLIDGFSTISQGISIGSLSTKTLKEYISEHRLAGNR